MKKLLFVYAHPDDETFGNGGTIAKYHQLGVEVSLISATSGCKGKSGEYTFQSKEQLAAHREGELRKACDILGVSNLILYRYPDGGLKDVDPDELSERVHQSIVDIKPDVIVTFPPDGITAHPDHIAISLATDKAVLRAEQEYSAGEEPTYYYAAIPKAVRQAMGLAEGLAPTGRIDMTEYRHLKAEALRQHRTQVYSVDRGYPGVMQGDDYSIGSEEYYTLVRKKGQPADVTGEEVAVLPYLELFNGQ